MYQIQLNFSKKIYSWQNTAIFQYYRRYLRDERSFFGLFFFKTTGENERQSGEAVLKLFLLSVNRSVRYIYIYTIYIRFYPLYARNSDRIEIEIHIGKDKVPLFCVGILPVVPLLHLPRTAVCRFRLVSFGFPGLLISDNADSSSSHLRYLRGLNFCARYLILIPILYRDKFLFVRSSNRSTSVLRRIFDLFQVSK